MALHDDVLLEIKVHRTSLEMGVTGSSQQSWFIRSMPLILPEHRAR